MKTKTILLLVGLSIGGYFLVKKWKAAVAAPAVLPPTSYAESLAVKYQFPVEEVIALIQAIPVSKWGPPPEVVAEKILAQK